MALSLPLTFMLARQAKPSVVVGGVDILMGLASQNILSFSYTDNTSDQADDLCLEIADPHRIWMQHYLPKKGVEIQASIILVNWNAPGDNRTLRCGTFYCDNVGMRGPPNVVTMRATSIPPTGLKTEKRTKSWENSDLQSIAGGIAQTNGLTLVYDARNNPTVKRTDQVEKADIQYLRERAKDNMLSIKVHDKKLVIYSEQEYEAKAAAFILMYGKSNILDYVFNSKCDDVYEGAENSYVNPETGKLTQTEFTPDKPPEGTGSTMKINERVDYDKDGMPSYGYGQRRSGNLPSYDYANDAPAQNEGKGEGTQARSLQKCKAKLREKNKKERTCSLSVVGNVSYLSGITFQLMGFGIFDDKWFAESTIHEISGGGYITQLKLRTALEGY